jgi:hypothetical protein
MSHTGSTVDMLLIRPTHGDQTGAGDNKRTHHWEGIRNGRLVKESRPLPPTPSLPINTTKSADPSLTARRALPESSFDLSKRHQPGFRGLRYAVS